MLQLLSNKISIFSRIILLAAVLIVSGCNQITETLPADRSPTSTPSPTATQPATATPEIPSILFIPGGDDFFHIEEHLRSALLDLAEQEGWILVEGSTLSESEITEQTRVLVVLETSENFLEIVTDNPHVHFITIGAQGIQAQANLSIIGPTGFRLDQQAFLGGYIAAVLTEDWRIGTIIDLPEEYRPTVESGFRNGMEFYCGLCLLAYPPFNEYPVQTSVDRSAGQADWSSSIARIEDNAVETVLLFSEEIDSEAMMELIERGVRFIGIGPPPQALLSSWITSVRFAPELAIAERWKEIVSMEGGWTLPIPLILDDVNPSLFSEGRQTFVDNMVAGLLSGYIDPAVTPPAPASSP